MCLCSNLHHVDAGFLHILAIHVNQSASYKWEVPEAFKPPSFTRCQNVLRATFGGLPSHKNFIMCESICLIFTFGIVEVTAINTNLETSRYLTIAILPFMVNPRPHLLFRHPRPHLRGGGHPPARLSPNWNRASQQKQTERSRCFESKHTRFYYIRSHFDLSRAGQIKNVTFLGRSSFWQITFELKKIERNAKHHHISLIKTHQNM